MRETRAWWEKLTIYCKSQEDYEFWSSAVRVIEILRDNLGDSNATLRVLENLSLSTMPIEDERLITAKLTADEVIRAIDRELKIKQERERHMKIFGRGIGGRKSKVDEYMWMVKNAKDEEERKEIIDRAKRELSKTSFWRFKKKLINVIKK